MGVALSKLTSLSLSLAPAMAAIAVTPSTAPPCSWEEMDRLRLTGMLAGSQKGMGGGSSCLCPLRALVRGRGRSRRGRGRRRR